MPRPSRLDEQRRELLPIVCRTFSELGYQRTTTAELARRCEVRENILYRLWADKKGMFLAAIGDLFKRRAATWNELLADRPSAAEAVARLAAFEAKHQGEFGFHRIVFTALAEADDAEIRAALVGMYRSFQKLVRKQVEAGRGGKADRASAGGSDLKADDAAWALLGLATISNIVRELDLLPARGRERMFAAVARHLVSNEPA